MKGDVWRRERDGAELSEDDVGTLAHEVVARNRSYNGPLLTLALGVLEALAPEPKTCGAYMEDANGDSCGFCVLPPGHHLYKRGFNVGGPEYCCVFGPTDSIHAPGHMTASETWREP